MRRCVSVFLILGLILQGSVPVFAQDESKISIAIMDFQNTSASSNLDYLQKSIPEMLITNLAKRGKLNIVERSRLEDALNEMQLGMTGVVDQSKAVELGKAVGANAIMVGSYLDIGGIIRINARLIDVQTSKVLKAESVQGRTGQEIFDLMDQLANSIENQLLGEAKPKRPEVAEKKPETPPQKTTPQVEKKKGGSHTALYVLGGAALIGGGVAAALLLGGSSNNGKENNSSVSVTVNIP